MDQEPGRCRRTDGKKWRCNRDVLPDQKYCERHMHRGRQRSRKLVEITKKVTKPNSPKTFNSNNTPITINYPESAKKIFNSSSQLPAILQQIHNPSSDTIFKVCSVSTPTYTTSPIVYNRRKGSGSVKNDSLTGSTTYITTYSDSNETLNIKRSSKNILSDSTSSDVASGSDIPPKGVILSGVGCDTSTGAHPETPDAPRCRRTDGRKWRCSSNVLPDQKYCLQHINRGKKKLTTPSNPVPISSFPPSPPILGNSNTVLSVPPISIQRTLISENGISSISGSSSDATTITDDENTSDSSKYIIKARTSNLQTPF